MGGMLGRHPGDAPIAPPEYKRDDGENTCYSAALRCLSHYFTGERNYGDVDPDSTDKFLHQLDLAEVAEVAEEISLSPATVKQMVSEVEKAKDAKKRKAEEEAADDE